MKSNDFIDKYNDILESILIEYIFVEDINDILYRAKRKYEEIEKLLEDKEDKKSKKEIRKKGKVNIYCEDRICEYTANEELRDNIREFCQIREMRGVPILSQNTISRLLNKLNKYGKNDEEKISVLEYSIDRNYPDIYPFKSAYGQKNGSSIQNNNKNFCKNINIPSLVGSDLEEYILGKNDLDEF